MKNLTPIPLLEVGGFTVGHAQDYEAATGCTVLLFDACSPAGVAVRGGGPASRETPLLDPLAASEGIHGLLLSGGSAFGLDAAGGVMKYLEERNIGFDTGITKVPLVCQSCVFDLVIGRPDVRPDPAMAYKACEDGDRRIQRPAGSGRKPGRWMRLYGRKIPWASIRHEKRFGMFCRPGGQAEGRRHCGG